MWWLWYGKLSSRKITITQKKKWKTFKIHQNKTKYREDREYYILSAHWNTYQIVMMDFCWITISDRRNPISISVKKNPEFIGGCIFFYFLCGCVFYHFVHITIYCHNALWNNLMFIWSFKRMCKVITS